MKNLKTASICGSLRKDSYNKKLLELAHKIVRDEGSELNYIDLNELNLPLYNNDMEKDTIPESVKKLRTEISSCDVFLIASPEHNYSVSSALKNAIDWISRVKPSPLDGKTVAIFGVSTGPMGTVRGQNQLRQILTILNVHLLPQPQVCVPFAESAFEPDGSLKIKTYEENLRLLIKTTFDFAEKLRKTA